MHGDSQFMTRSVNSLRQSLTKMGCGACPVHNALQSNAILGAKREIMREAQFTSAKPTIHLFKQLLKNLIKGEVI